MALCIAQGVFSVLCRFMMDLSKSLVRKDMEKSDCINNFGQKFKILLIFAGRNHLFVTSHQTSYLNITFSMRMFPSWTKAMK